MWGAVLGQITGILLAAGVVLGGAYWYVSGQKADTEAAAVDAVCGALHGRAVAIRIEGGSIWACLLPNGLIKVL